MNDVKVRDIERKKSICLKSNLKYILIYISLYNKKNYKGYERKELKEERREKRDRNFGFPNQKLYNLRTIVVVVVVMIRLCNRIARN